MEMIRAPRKILATPKFKTAHTFLRDGGTPPAPSKTERTEVVVVGGGIAGLTAAARLQTEGVRVTLLESENRVGGTAASEELAGGSVPLGSVYFVERTDDLDLLLRMGGVEPVVCPDDGYDFGNGEVVVDLWKDEIMDRVIKGRDNLDGMKRFRDYVIGLGDDIPLYPLPDELPPHLRELDVASEEWVRSFKSQTLHTILDSYSRSSMGALLSRTNLFCLLNFYSGEFGPSFDLPRYTVPGGTGFMTSAVLPTLDDVRLGQIAVRIHNKGQGATVDAVDENGDVIRYEADRVIMSGHKFQMPYLIPDLPAEQVKACREMSYAPYMTLHIISDVPMVEPDIYDTWNLSSEFETDVVNPVSVPGTTFNKYVASLYIPMDEFARGQLQNEQLFARKTADIVDRFIGTKSPEQRASVREVYAWGWGHGLVIPTPGSHSGIAQAASRRFGNILFANSDNDASPAIENAADHGGRAALKVLAELRA